MESRCADNLLFGLLALQIGMVEQDQLLAAFRRWIQGKDRSIAGLLIDAGHLQEADRSAIEALVTRHIDRHGGEVEQSLASISTEGSICRRLAEFEDPDLDATLGFMVPPSTEVADRTASLGSGSTSRTGLPRFRLLRPHARGGLGAVYVALDAELNREVALKQILDERADHAESRQRFLVEAEVTGGLEHPGIVPVYGKGTYEDGRPYYAMRFIKGESLKQAIARYHSDRPPVKAGSNRQLGLRKLLRRFQDVCNAVSYAHSRGVLHRDIKPSNIILGKFDETLLVDWGLAKITGRSDPSTSEQTILPPASGSSEQTIPGSALGTPPFMSPEQAMGDLDRLGPASDVYSLGATLYHLLCGRVPFESDDIGSVLQAVVRGEYLRPREVDPTIDPALESICLKAMAGKPEDRYASARALAEDLERWMADEPVESFREPRARRIARWVRHHAAVAASLGVLLAAAAASLAIVALLISRQNSLNELARTEISRQVVRAERSGAMARRAVREMLDKVARRDLLNVPQAEPLRITLAEQALALNRDLVREFPENPAFRFDLATVAEEVGRLYRMIGRYEPARLLYDEVIASLETLVREDPARPNYRESLSNARSQLGELIKMRGGSDAEAEPHYRAAVDAAARLRSAHPREPRYASLVSRTHGDLASMLIGAGRYEEAAPLLSEAASAARDHRTSLPRAPDPKDYRTYWLILPLALNSQGSLLSRLGRDAEAQTVLDESVRVIRGLLESYPKGNDLRLLLSDALRELGGVLLRTPSRESGSLATFDESVALITTLISDFPKVATYPTDLATARLDRGEARLALGDLRGATVDLAAAEGHFTGLERAAKDSLESTQQLGKIKGLQSRLAARQGKREAARSLVSEAIRLQRKAVSLEPANPINRKLLEGHLTLSRELE